MTKQEFQTEGDKLIQCFPQSFNTARLSMIYFEVRDLDHKWWIDTVKRMVLSGNPRADISEAARAYRNSMASLRSAQGVADAHQAIQEKMSERGLSDALKSFGANSLLDAISSSRRK